jgi:hypothetical protein
VPADWPAGLTAPVAIPLPAGPWDSAPAAKAPLTLTATIQVEGESQVRQLPAQIESEPAARSSRAWIMWAAGPVDLGKKVTITFDEPRPATRTLYQSRYTDALLKI